MVVCYYFAPSPLPFPSSSLAPPYFPWILRRDDDSQENESNSAERLKTNDQSSKSASHSSFSSPPPPVIAPPLNPPNGFEEPISKSSPIIFPIEPNPPPPPPPPPPLPDVEALYAYSFTRQVSDYETEEGKVAGRESSHTCKTNSLDRPISFP